MALLCWQLVPTYKVKLTPQNYTPPRIKPYPRAIGAEVAALPGSAVLGWVRVSAKPLKQALATWASKWVYLFTKYLQDKVGWG